MPIRMDNCYTHQLAFSLGGAEFFGPMTSDNRFPDCGVDNIVGFV